MRILAFGMMMVISVVSWAATAEDCGEGGRCLVDEGYYLAELPDDWDGTKPLPLVVFFHGWNSSPEGMFRNRALVDGITRRGAIFLAPFAQTGYWRQIGEGRAERGRDELAYVKAVMNDVRRRWPIDASQTLASGFSRGASMVWNVACYAGDQFRAYLPIAGGFWHSDPDHCPTGPVNLRHIHGQSDRVVAFDRVGIYNSMPIPSGFELLKQLNGCGVRPEGRDRHGRYDCERWSDCASGRDLELCLHPGGHSIPAEWVVDGLIWMQGLGDR